MPELDNGKGLMKEIRPVDSNKILYFYKLSTDGKDAKAKMLGLQGATSGTNTKQLQSTQLKQGTIKMAGSKNQQRTVAAYFQVNDPVYDDMKKAWDDDDVIIHLYRVDLNTITGKAPSRQAKAEYSQCLLPNFPFTEGLASVLTSSLVLEVNGVAVDGVVTEDMLEDGAFDEGRRFYDFMKPTEVGEAAAGGSGVQSAPSNQGGVSTDK